MSDIGKFFVVKFVDEDKERYVIELNYLNSKSELHASYITRPTKVYLNRTEVSKTGTKIEIERVLALEIHDLFKQYQDKYNSDIVKDAIIKKLIELSINI
jgi:hypothetical protein